MPASLAEKFTQLSGKLTSGRPLLVLVPALSLMSFWLGGETALIIVAIGVPFILWCLSIIGKGSDSADGRDGLTGMHRSDDWRRQALARLDHANQSGTRSAVFMVRIDDLEQVSERFGQTATDNVIRQTAARILSMLRTGDIACHMGDGVYHICLASQQMLDLEICLQIAGRITGAIEEPLSVDGTHIYVTACVGFCQLGRSDAEFGTAESEATISGAARALDAAMNVGPSAIRAFSKDSQILRATSKANDVVDALEQGQFQAWFQPQISTDTGKISGFEALARWVAPDRGIVPPSEFLPALEAAGALGRLSEIMLFQSLTALKGWDQAGLDIPCVGVNFSGAELSDPDLVNKVKWELDRFELTPDRLAVEILETVVASEPDDIICRNISGLSALGCKIDLDDFGTGHASLASIRRFSVGRIKIDRSFVMKADRDPEQQRMVNAIISMAERLGLETLAEGIETVGEHALLAQLGCTYVQGFGIGRPMPFEQTQEWIGIHNGKLQEAPRIDRKR